MLKKALSVLLCAAVLISVMSVGFTVSAVECSGVVGDADNDGVVTPVDARLVLRAAARIAVDISAENVVLCDINGDGYLSIYDACQILRCAIGLVRLEPTGAFTKFTGNGIFQTEDELVSYFNSNVNEIKVQKAGFVKETTSDLADFVADNATVSGTSINVSTITNLIKEKIGESVSEADETVQVMKDEASYFSKMPVEGESYVSGLTPADVLGSKAELDSVTNTLKITIALADTEITEISDSGYSRIFDVAKIEEAANGTLTTVFSSLSSGSKRNISVINGTVTAEFDYATGKVVSYKTYYMLDVLMSDVSLSLLSLTSKASGIGSIFGGGIKVEKVEYKSNHTSYFHNFVW